MGKTNNKLKKDILPTEKESRHEWHKKKIREKEKIHKEIEEFGKDELKEDDNETDLYGSTEE